MDRRGLFLLLLFSCAAAPGCVGNVQFLNVEEDEGMIFCSFEHYSWPGFDTGTLRSSDEGITWNRIYPIEDGRDAVFVCRCKAGLLAELDDGTWCRSTDRGGSWQPVNGLEGSARTRPTSTGDGELVYVGTRAGVFRSTDGGANWAPTDTVGMRHEQIDDIAATSTAVYFVAHEVAWWTMGSPTGWGFYRSNDSGRTWVDIAGNLPPYFTEAYRKKLGPSCAATDSTLLIWASRWASSDRRPHLSDDNGVTWTRILDTNVVGLFESDTSFLACVFIRKEMKYAMLLSTDAGHTWHPHAGSPPGGGSDIRAYPSAKGLFTPFRKESPDGTFFRSRDGGRGWEKMTVRGY